jgi:uncharacterized protein (TIGR03067 family)
MRHILLALLTALVLVAADDPKDDATKKDLEKMQGDWCAASMIVDGLVVPDDDAQSLFRTVKGEEYTVFKYDRMRGKGTFKLDATKKPKTIDAFPAADPSKPILGIYEFDGDSYKACFSTPGKDRPTEFASKEGSGLTLTVWEREKKK